MLHAVRGGGISISSVKVQALARLEPEQVAANGRRAAAAHSGMTAGCCDRPACRLSSLGSPLRPPLAAAESLLHRLPILALLLLAPSVYVEAAARTQRWGRMNAM